MTSLKQITAEARSIKSRKCKENSKKIVSFREYSDDDMTEDESNWLEVPEENTSDKPTQVRKIVTRKNRNVKVTHNAANSELNFAKMYKNRYDACNRDLITVDKSNGSSNKTRQKYVKILFQTGLFEAMKKNIVNIMQNQFGVSLVDGKDPKVEIYGRSKAEERFILNLQFKESEVDHTVQVTIYNTNCTMGIDSVGASAHSVISGQTVAEYFVEKVMFEVVEVLKEKVNIEELNSQCRKMSQLGIKLQGKSKSVCYGCNKDKLGLSCAKLSSSWLQAYSASDQPN